MKKIIALACTLVMLVSMFTISANAAVDGCTVTLDFAGYTHNDAGTVTYALVDVYVTIPDTLAPYEVGENDEGDEIFSGRMLQSVGIDIPTPAGLKFNTSRSQAASYVQIQNDTTAGKVKVYAANTGAYSTYYAGTIDKVATIAYKIEATEAVELTITDAVIGLVDVAEDGKVTPREYKFADFTCTGETVAPEVKEPTYKEETADEDEAALTAETIDGYTNHAIYVHKFVAPEVATGETVNYCGFKVVGKEVQPATIAADAINGGVTYVLAIVGIGEDTATVKPFYNVTRLVEVTE